MSESTGSSYAYAKAPTSVLSTSSCDSSDGHGTVGNGLTPPLKSTGMDTDDDDDDDDDVIESDPHDSDLEFAGTSTRKCKIEFSAVDDEDILFFVL
jgi:hypothetical protein